MSTSAEPSVAPAATRNRLPYLVTTQTLGGIGVASGVAVGTLLAEQVSGSTSLAGLAQTASVLGGALLAVPLAAAAERRGRAPALATGYLLAAVGSAVVLAGALRGWFWLLIAGMALFGAATAAGLQARYAAIDGVDGPHRGRVLSMVVWSTTVGAVLGPNLAGVGGRAGAALGVPDLAGPFLFGLAGFGVAAVVALLLPGGRRPTGHRESATSTRRALLAVRTSPPALAGMAALAGAHAIMVAVMVMTPVHIGRGGATLQVVGLVISLHVAGMYALSPVMGWLADRWGTRPTIGLGIAVLTVSLVTAASAGPHQHARIGLGLTLLGLGWSACMVAGSALLSAGVPDDVRTKVQGTGDLMMGLAAATAGVFSGPILQAAGYEWLALGSLLLVVPIVVLLLRGRATPEAAA